MGSVTVPLPDGRVMEVWDEWWDGLSEDERAAEIRETMEDRGPTLKPWDELTEGEKYLTRKMQSEAEVNAALSAAGYESIFDLPSEHDPDPGVPDNPTLTSPPRSARGGQGEL